MKKTIAITALLLGIAGSSSAQDGQWEFATTVYVWGSGIDSSIETSRGPIESEIEFGDILKDLDMAFMGVFEARRGNWGFVGDLIYTDLSSTTATPFGALFAAADVDTRMTTFSGYALYRAVDGPTGSMDVGGGIRANSLDIDVTLQPGTLPLEAFSVGDSWVDPLVAARVKVPLSDRWYATAFVDVGGFGIDSDLTWQVVGTVGYDITDRWSVRMGYRHMSTERTSGGRDIELELSGPIVGATARW